jgi:hypothetical protein
MKTSTAKIIILNHKQWQDAGNWETLTKGLRLPVQVTEEIYTEFLEVLPPEEYGKTRHEFIDISLPITDYFLVGEPMTTVNGRPVYATFARALGKCYFLGYMYKNQTI